MTYLAQDHYEKFHLKYIKWNLSVHSKASNIGCWGETGRYPLFLGATKLAIDYFEHVQERTNLSDNSLLAAAFNEQRDLSLPWYTNISMLMKKHIHPLNPKLRPSLSTLESLKQEFIENWKSSKKKFITKTRIL